MREQLGFADAFADARLGSNRKLSEIDELIDWSVLERLVRQMRPGTQGRPPFAALAMLKALYLQRLYDLSDPGLEEALADRFSFRRFCGFPWQIPRRTRPRSCVFATMLRVPACWSNASSR
jgi:hypothetical protein